MLGLNRFVLRQRITPGFPAACDSVIKIFGIPLCPPQTRLSGVALFALYLLDARLDLHPMPPVTRTTTGKLPVARKYVDDEASVPLSDTDSNGRRGSSSFWRSASHHILTSLSCVTALEPNSSTSETRTQKSAKRVKMTVASSQRGESKNAKPQGLSRRKQGRLRNLPTMPLDILFEVCRHPFFRSSRLISCHLDI